MEKSRWRSSLSRMYGARGLIERCWKERTSILAFAYGFLSPTFSGGYSPFFIVNIIFLVIAASGRGRVERGDIDTLVTRDVCYG